MSEEKFGPNPNPDKPISSRAIFGTAVCISLLLLAVLLFISAEEQPSAQRQDLFKVCLSLFQVAIGGILGFLTGKKVG